MSAKPLEGMTIVFTGRMQKARADMEAEAHRLGGYTQPNVTSRTNWLVTGTRVGATKMNAAQRWGTRTLTVSEYQEEVRARQTAALEEEAKRAEAETPIVAAVTERKQEPDWATSVRTSRSLRF